MFLLLLLLVYVHIPFPVNAQPTPPELPYAYSVSINLTQAGWSKPDLMQVYYTWDKSNFQQRKQRADHTNFRDTRTVVSLFFQDSRVYAVNRVNSDCCIMFASNMQAPPYWLTDAKYLGTQVVNGKVADTWYQNGYTWFDDPTTSTPLQWTWQVVPSIPKIIATMAYFSAQPQPGNLFTLPSTCNVASICPIPLYDEAEAGIWIGSII